jgi:glycerophosphoryl diester phosphodiesterase
MQAMYEDCDYIEMDILSTKDGQLVVLHSPNLQEITNIELLPEFASYKRKDIYENEVHEGWFVQDLTLQQIKKLYVKQRFPDRNQNFNNLYQILTFDEALQFINSIDNTTTGVYVETKHAHYFRLLGLPIEEKMLNTLVKYNYILMHNNEYIINKEKNLFIQSFESTSLKWFHNKVKDIKNVQLCKEGYLIQNGN